MTVDILIGIGVGIGLGVAVTAWLGLRRRTALQVQLAQAETQLGELAQLREQLQALQAEQQSATTELTEMRSAKDHATALLQEARDSIERQREQLGQREDELNAAQRHQARLQEALDQERRQAAEKLALLNQAREELADRFKALASEVVAKQSEQAGKQQQERLDQTLKPFKEQLSRFEKQVQDTYTRETKERIDLRAELRHLAELNTKMSKEAEGLAKALTGHVKTRGNWGEVILERLLEHSGLRKDQEYRIQQSYKAEDGSRLQPDVIVDLPEQRSLVIDAKVNLISWIALSEAEDETSADQARRDLLVAMRAHVKQLSDKQYQRLYELDTLDFVLLFIPIEAAFAEVLSADQKLYNEALSKNIVIVSPTTLLATMRTIASIWRYDRQEKNALKIAETAGRMYDQLVGYVSSFEDIGKRLQQAQGSYDLAHARLTSGRGNLVRRAEQMRQLGAKTAKRLGKTLREEAQSGEATQTELPFAQEPSTGKEPDETEITAEDHEDREDLLEQQ